ncbi:MAG: cytochrome ubiquinol oxidase subunit I, partial [Demequina sp.]
MATADYAEDRPQHGTVALPVAPSRSGSLIVKWITSTDHKTIGYMYLITSFIFFIIGGVMALVIRAELFEPGMQIVQS